MGLQEKQAWAWVKVKIEEASQEVNSASGAKIELKLLEESFATKDLIENIPSAVLGYLVSGFNDLCKDNIAREAVQASVKGVTISQASTENFELKMANGILEVAGNFDSSSTCGIHYPHNNDYVTFLTQNL